MKNLRKILSVILALVLVLCLCACGEKKEAPAKKAETKKEPSPQQIVSGAPGNLTIIAGVHLVIGYDEEGNALAVAENLAERTEVTAELVKSCPSVKGMSCAEAVQVVLQHMTEKDALQPRSYVIIRQERDSLTPDENFLKNILAAAEETMGAIPVICVGIADQDDDGYFSQEIAKQVLLAFLDEGSEILAASVLIDGCYHISAKQGSAPEDFVVSGFTGSVTLAADLNSEPINEEDMIPESEQFDPPVEEGLEEGPDADPLPEDEEEYIADEDTAAN